MAKRFTDTEKWKKPFLRSIKTPYKLLWLYICDNCDHAGIWQVDFQVAEIMIGEKLNEKEALKCFAGKVFVFDKNEKWFIPSFVEFQYGVLNKENRVHASILRQIEKYQLDINKPLTSPLQGVKDKDMDKDMDMDMEKEKDKEPKKSSELHAKFIEVFSDFYFDLHQMKYQFQSGKDGTAVKQLIGKVQASVSERRPDYVDGDILGAFQFILNNLNDWFKSQGCSLSVINSKYNEIIAGIKTQKTKTNGGLSTEYLSDLKNRLQGN